MNDSNKAAKLTRRRFQYWPSDVLFFAYVTALLLLQIVHSMWGLDLAYARSGINDGQYWRVISGHLTHTNSIHLGMNLAVFALLYLFVRTSSHASLLLASLLPCAILSSLLLWVFAPTLSWYYGFSGVLHGFAILCAAALIRENSPMGLGLLALFIGKIVWEQSPWYSDATLAGLIDVRVATEAHLLGAIAALSLIITFNLYLHRKVWR